MGLKTALVFLGCFLGVSGQTRNSCNMACGSAIQVNGQIECYCHANCIIGDPGECCDDFETECPDEYIAGQTAVSSQTNTNGQEALPSSLPAGCELPESYVIPVPKLTYQWNEAGNSCKDHCDSAMVDEDDSLVCFCDSGCVLTSDCCPDFIFQCEVDECIIAMFNPTVEEDAGATWRPGSCWNSCGDMVAGSQGQSVCSCESVCVEDSSCCPDFPEECPNLVDLSLIPVVSEVKAGSCFGKCGEGSGKCWCDYQCINTGDCCDDYEDMCGATFGLIMWTGQGSCHNKCGGAGYDCWCDPKCKHMGDCCDDYLSKCEAQA